MDVFDIIKTRRSTRAFKQIPVEQKKIIEIVEAGRYAPSGGNSQTTHFIVIKDNNVLQEIADLVKQEFAKMEYSPDLYVSLQNSIKRSKEGTYIFHYGAPVLIVTANKKDYGNNMADCACALENMMIMANALDLGSCYINQLKWLNENPVLLSYMRNLGLAEDERIYGSLALGYANTHDGMPVRAALPRKGNPVTIIDPEFVTYSKALNNRREPIQNPRVVYQGEPGAFSEQASANFFGEGVNALGMHGFEDTFKALRDGTADYAVLPIENSSTGAIRQVYDLLTQYDCYMVGETTVTVDQSLLVLPGTRLEDITTVFSHEQGLFQCEQFLNQHPDWKQISQVDTAGSARMVAEMQDPHIAAICSARAAKIYGLEVLKESINYNSVNTTRFVVISPRMELREGRDKICISLTAPHESGSLYEVLSIFKANHLNLVKLESRPILGQNWDYMFFIEFTGSLSTEGKDYFLLEIMHATKNLKVFGNFKSNL